jgi:2-polyprenyl-3-methyl-5-hydroxy-6-metoxy-1,4-benzoquinol methylase
MKIKRWGEQVWEEKIKEQGEVGVVSGTNATTSLVDLKVRRFFEIFSNNFQKYISPKGIILDCGVGPLANYAIEFSKRGHEVTGVDLSETTIKYAIKNAEKAKQKIKFEKDNLVTLNNIKDSFDLVFCVGTFGHIPSYLALDTLKSFMKKTKKEGHCIVEFWIEKEKKFSTILKDFLYWSGHVLKRTFNKKTFPVNCSYYTHEEIREMCNLVGLEVVKNIGGFYLFKIKG